MPDPPEPETAGAADEARTDAIAPATPPAPGATDPKPRTRRRAASKRKPAAAKKAAKPTAASKPGAGASTPVRPPTTTELRNQRANAISELLCIPAIPCSMIGNQVLTYHFTNVGPITAMRLAELAEQSPEIASVIDKATAGNVAMGLVMATAGYLAPVLLYMTKGPELSHAATQGVEMMNMAPGTLAAMIGAMRSADAAGGEGSDDDEAAVPPEHGPAPGPGQP